jgi:hypothetical protein
MVSSVMDDWSSFNNTSTGIVHISESGESMTGVDAVRGELFFLAFFFSVVLFEASPLN